MDRTYRNLRAVGVLLVDVDMVLVTVAVNALACLAESDKRYEGVIRSVVMLAQHPEPTP